MTIHVTLLEEEDLWKMDLNDPGKPKKKEEKKGMFPGNRQPTPGLPGRSIDSFGFSDASLMLAEDY